MSGTVANNKGYTTTTAVDFATGATTKVTDPNNKVTDSEYDALGRVTKVWLPNRLKILGASPNYVYGYSVKATSAPWVSTGAIKGDGSGYNTTYEIYDSLLRARQTQTPSPVGGTVIAETLYDERGLAVTSLADTWADKAVPSGTLLQTEGSSAPMESDTTYDGAGRATQAVTKVRGVTRFTTNTTYAGDTAATSAPAGGQATMVVTNALGQITERREYAGPQPTGSNYTTTGYAYTPAGQQKTVTGPDQAKWSYTYDLFGRQVDTDDPDKGPSSTVYNELDQATSTTDSAGKTLLSAYDSLGRQTDLWDGTKSDATKLASWTFDTQDKGQQDTATRYDGGTAGKAYTSKVTGYDNLYRVTGSQLILPDAAKEPLVAAGVPQTLSFTTGYNLDGTVSQASQPAVAGLPSEVMSPKYNALGQQTTLAGTTGYLQGAAYSPQGDLRQLTLGTDPTTSAKKAYLNYDYEDGTRRLTRSYVTDDVHGYMPQDLNFTQDDAGNVTSIFDASTQGGTAKPDNQCFAYDGDTRLTEAWTPQTADCATSGRTSANIDGAAPYWTSYTYNESGQRHTETQHTTAGDSTTTYAYGTTTGQPHPLTGTTGPKTSTYAYDKTGNTTSRPGTQAQQTLTWNSEGKLASTTEPAVGSKPKLDTSYLYDAGGQLLIRRASGDGDTVLYLGATEIHLTAKGTTKTLTGTRYYTAAGQTIALRTATKDVTGTKLTFLASDPHGTATLALAPATWAYTKRYTTPFGTSRGTKPSSWPDDKAFLGKPADTSTGLTHIGAREYDPTTGQFLSVDPLLELNKHQSLNGYTYGENNPVTKADPTGQGSFTCNGNCDGQTNFIESHDAPNFTSGQTWQQKYPDYPAAGTSHTTSTGSTLKKTWNWLTGGVYTALNYGSSIVSNGDIWQGVLETYLSTLAIQAGPDVILVGGAECLTLWGCIGSVPTVTVGSGMIVGGAFGAKDGIERIEKGLGKALREAKGDGSSASQEINWKPNSVKTYGHTFSDHGARNSIQKMADRAKNKGVENNGQWHDNESAANILRENYRPEAKKAYLIEIPKGAGRVVYQDGRTAEATHALVVPRGSSGLIKTAYPVIP
ncbi:RHS repeat-associated core domain-containing protein [Streptomyces sp. NBC_00344]|uniref:RHS repeat-associated core domain-containing protein n=1 Tax=Streptomyces sp. NBC_00344 TaxID=2975720 RepID=UPI002E1AB00C